MRVLFQVFLVASLAAPYTVSAQPCGSGDTITAVPALPLAGEVITLELRGTSKLLWPFLFDTTHEIQGTTIRVDTTLDPGSFLGPMFYGANYELGPLLPGSYSVEEWIQCWGDGPLGEPYLAATTSLVVGGGTVPAIPTLSESGLGVLLTSLVLAGMVLMRRRR